MDTKHTPGPWVLVVLMHDDPNGDEWPTDVEISGPDGFHIYGHDLGYDGDVDSRIMANARLIAAAPDMAATIEAQAAEIAKLKIRAANAVRMLDDQDREYNRKTNDLIARHAKQVSAQAAEIARLREALKKLDVGEGWAAQIARAALGDAP